MSAAIAEAVCQLLLAILLLGDALMRICVRRGVGDMAGCGILAVLRDFA
jgi:hypothetical protein